jgi:hypothetical protein
MAKQVDKVKMAEVKQELANPTPDAQNVVKTLSLDLSLGRLITTLEQLVAEEQAQYQNQAPTQTGIERWALKSAVLDYYKGLGLPGTTKVIDDPTKLKTAREFAPDKKAVYGLWLKKLADLTKKDDVNQFAIPQYDQDVERGTVQGGAFEKMLERYREEFVGEMLKRQG